MQGNTGNTVLLISSGSVIIIRQNKKNVNYVVVNDTFLASIDLRELSKEKKTIFVLLIFL